MLDSELQERLKSQRTKPDTRNAAGLKFVLPSVTAGILIGIAGAYLFTQYNQESFEKELGQMVIIASECRNLDPATTLKAVENEIGRPLSEFSEANMLRAFSYLAKNTDPNDCLFHTEPSN
ncbi:MAG: hypothetical protein COA52_08940 [Hyphomicrobiales bacterium]|nr:hypothetical protein [Hyphomicrobiales bacterium]PCJ91263.1 MAG: hypothetical protein COA52_08940 [Hyphomicrobiales bacterium]